MADEIQQEEPQKGNEIVIRDTVTCKPSEKEKRVLQKLMKKGMNLNDALKYCIRVTADWGI